MADKSWKAFERRIARLLGGRRNPLTGERAAADVESSRIVGQCKKGRRMPAYLYEWLCGIEGFRDDHAPEKAACVIWQQWKAEDLDSLVVLRLRDLLRLMKVTDE